MATEPDIQLLYSRLCKARLESAAILHRQHPDCHFDTGIEALIIRCNIAMLVWSAAVDLGSSLMIQEDQRIPTGNSGEITEYITRTMARRLPLLDLSTSWRRPVWLHNIQHRADHQAARFAIACRSSLEAFATINQLLNPVSRLTPTSYDWLATVGEN
jgi:hypothetical protein